MKRQRFEGDILNTVKNFLKNKESNIDKEQKNKQKINNLFRSCNIFIPYHSVLQTSIVTWEKETKVK